VSCPVALTDALRARFDACQQPRGLHLLWGVAMGDFERGICRRAARRPARGSGARVCRRA